MPRFFFDVFDGRNLRDDTGTELPDQDRARCEAVRLAGGILDDDARRITEAGNWHMEVRDEGGALLSRLVFTVTAPPVAAVDR